MRKEVESIWASWALLRRKRKIGTQNLLGFLFNFYYIKIFAYTFVPISASNSFHTALAILMN
jgi:hypothetical protein